MAGKMFSLYRAVLIVTAICVLIVLAGWKSMIRDTPKFDHFFDPSENTLLHIDADGNEDDSEIEGDNTIATIAPLSETNSTVISSFSFVAARPAMRYMLNVRLTMDLYQYHSDNPSFFEPLAKGVSAVFYEERLLNNGLEGLMIRASFSDSENKTIPEELRTIKPGYTLAVKLNPELCPGFFYIASPKKGPMCLIRGEVR